VSGLAADRPPQVLSVDASLFSARPPSDVAAPAASLPRLFRAAAPALASDVRVVDPASPSWPQLLAQALDTSVRGILLPAPGLADAAGVAALAGKVESARCPVVVAMPFPSGSITRRQPKPGTEAAPLSFIDSIVTVPDDGAREPRSALGAALLSQLAAIRAILGPVPGLTMNYETDHAYSAVADLGGVTVALAGLVSAAGPPALRVDLVGPRHRYSVYLTGSYAAPARFWSYGQEGTSRPPLSYDSGLRTAWRNLHGAVTGREPVRFGLRELAQDLAAAAGRRPP
jgi:hypothetical protein